VKQAKWGKPAATEVGGLWREKVRELVNKRTEELLDVHKDWNAIVNLRTMDLITTEDLKRIDEEILSSGRRYDWSAQISRKEEPHKYKN
jgi:hypothetical protein